MCRLGLTAIKHLSLVTLLSWVMLSVVFGMSVVGQSNTPLLVELPRLTADPNGGTYQLPVVYSGDVNYPVGGFNLLIYYDTAAVSLRFVEPGSALSNCGWEYFHADPDSAGFVRLTAIADMAGVPGTPSCYLNGTDPDTLALLTVTVADDTALQCYDFHLEFFWLDCGDNAFSSVGGDSLFVEGTVQNPFYDQFPPTPDTLNSGMGLPDSCVALDPASILRRVYFHSFSLSFNCTDTIDQQGDLNLNGISYEIADWVLFQNYFLYGLSAFNTDPNIRAAQIAASDVNNDGTVLSIRDLAYIWRVIIGDALPYPKPTTSPPDVYVAFFENDSTQQQITFDYPENLCYIYLTFDGLVDVTSSDTADYIAYDQVDDTTRVLIRAAMYSEDGIFPGTVFTYSGTGTLLDIVAADWQDRLTPVILGSPPGCGDANADGILSISDGVAILSYIFGGVPLGDAAAADFDCSGSLTVGDVVGLVNYIFGGGPAPCASCP